MSQQGIGAWFWGALAGSALAVGCSQPRVRESATASASGDPPAEARPESPPAPAAGVDLRFEAYELPLGEEAGQTVLAGFFLGGPVADLALLLLDERGERFLRLYSLTEGRWESKLEVRLRPGVLVADVAKIDGRDRLITYSRGGLDWFDPETARERPLVEVSSSFLPPPEVEVPHVDFTRDLNGDGRDDLIVPDIDGCWIILQEERGVFAKPWKVGPPFLMAAVYDAEGYRYDAWSRSRIHELDYDRDGRRDLAFWKDDHFEVHLQDPKGRFRPQPETFTTDVPFDSDKLSTLVAPRGVRRRRMDYQPEGELNGRVLHRLGDVNGDGVADLVIFELAGSSLHRLSAAYEVHFGKPKLGRTEFAAEADTTIRSKGIIFGLVERDLDGDGASEVMLTNMKADLFRAPGILAGYLLTKSVAMRLEFYGLEGGQYPERPSTRRKLRTYPLGKHGGRTRHSTALLGDMDGDGREDLVLEWRRNELRVYRGVPGGDLLDDEPLEVEVDLPPEGFVWLTDLDRARGQDLLLHHRPADGPQRVIALVAR